MIEALVIYIEEKGFKVDVLENMLIIRTYVGDELLSLAWMFAPGEIEHMYKATLFFLADRKIEQMNKAIAERGQNEQ